MKDLLSQAKAAKLIIQRLGANLKFCRPESRTTEPLRVLCFCDAARPKERAQLGIFAGLLIGEYKPETILHPIGWYSGLSNTPVQSIGSGETQAAVFGADEGKQISAVYSLFAWY